jgi:hypothetical protein
MLSKASIELIWGLFIIITVISQIIKNAKKVSSQAPGKTGSDDNQRKPPGDELREFLEQLSGQQAQPVRPAAPKPPPRPIVQQRTQPKARKAKKVENATPLKITPPKNKPRIEPDHVVRIEKLTQPKRASEWHKTLRRELKDLDATRRAIVMREILGPPLALRQQQS